MKRWILPSSEVQSWWGSLKDYADTKSNLTSWEEMTTDYDLFSTVLSDWLFDSSGSGNKPHFRFDGNLSCNSPAPRILVSLTTFPASSAVLFCLKATRQRFAFLLFDGPEEHVPAKQRVEEVIRQSGLPHSFSFVKVYAAWETDEIIGYELLRNIGLALAAIFTVIFILLPNIRISVMVFLTVVLTLVDIVGFLHFWDITIDIISCVNIVLAVGLCVDYSVHIGHAYLTAEGAPHQRTLAALTTIGSAVLNGGITTFLALVLLGASTSHVFISFFKVFSLTVMFGLYHGLVLLPVLLCLLGPSQVPGVEGEGRGLDNRVFSPEDLSKRLGGLSSPEWS